MRVERENCKGEFCRPCVWSGGIPRLIERYLKNTSYPLFLKVFLDILPYSLFLLRVVIGGCIFYDAVRDAYGKSEQNDKNA